MICVAHSVTLALILTITAESSGGTRPSPIKVELICQIVFLVRFSLTCLYLYKCIWDESWHLEIIFSIRNSARPAFGKHSRHIFHLTLSVMNLHPYKCNNVCQPLPFSPSPTPGGPQRCSASSPSCSSPTAPALRPARPTVTGESEIVLIFSINLFSFLPRTCLTSSECAAKSGSAQGNCAAGFGVCCICELSLK